MSVSRLRVDAGHTKEAKEKGRPERLCARCGEMAPFEGHHIHGRKNSDELEDRCINCHRIGHALEE